MPRKIARIQQCLPGGAAFDDGGEVEQGKGFHVDAISMMGTRENSTRHRFRVC
jgi:hypothetical protein